MGSDRDDELGRTATAPGGAGARAAPAAPLDNMLGRYRIERELGAGGMGVVHAAFDPDLERRVALKVLRSEGGGEARQRLLREARAMARLAHPNVVTVHEVGSANGRDYVAMELVDGETLADWLRAEPRPADAILAAFVAAGRGLAAAHAAGIVHRDFKPHNVLRHPSGRIVVTDFGLARDAHDARTSDPLAVTLPVGPGSPAVATGSSPLAGLTATGSVLGTPAYMAPEQWSGGQVSPASDQFAFCVALWEALAGERPFRGTSVDELRAAIQRGPGALDASKLPRRLRAALRRGLDTDPARRWPSMDALLAAMLRRRGRATIALAISGAVLAAGVVVYALDDRGASAPAATPCSVLSIELPAEKRPELAYIERDVVAAIDAHVRECKAARGARTPKLACLEAVGARLEVAARGVAALPPNAPMIDIGSYTIAPAVCELETLPRLSPPSPQLAQVLAEMMREEARPGPISEASARELIARAGDEPCAGAWAHLMAARPGAATSERQRHLSAAEEHAERCPDERVRAEIGITVARHALAQAFLDAEISAKVKRATTAVQRVAQPDLLGDIEQLRMTVAKRAENLDEAIERGETAMARYAERGRIEAQLDAGLTTLRMREVRARPADLVKLETALPAWRELAVERLGANHPMVREIDGVLAWRRFLSGDVRGAYEMLDGLYPPVPYARARRLRGRVVDLRGAPVAGAKVTVGPGLIGTSAAAAIPFNGASLRTATSGPDGWFEFPEAPQDGMLVAELGTRRSLPVSIGDEVRLTLEPTGKLSGRVDLHGEPPSRVLVSVQDTRLSHVALRYELLAPVAADGTFAIEGVVRSKVRVFAVRRAANMRSLASVDVDLRRRPVVEGVQLAVSQQARVLYVIVRSTVSSPVGNAQVFVFPGERRSGTADKLELMGSSIISNARQLELEQAPAPVVAKARAGDMFSVMRDVPPGPASACAIGLPDDLSDPLLDRKIKANLDKIELRCVPVPPDAEAVVVEVPPWPRLD